MWLLWDMVPSFMPQYVLNEVCLLTVRYILEVLPLQSPTGIIPLSSMTVVWTNPVTRVPSYMGDFTLPLHYHHRGPRSLIIHQRRNNPWRLTQYDIRQYHQRIIHSLIKIVTGLPQLSMRTVSSLDLRGQSCRILWIILNLVPLSWLRPRYSNPLRNDFKKGARGVLIAVKSCYNQTAVNLTTDRISSGERSVSVIWWSFS